MNLSKKTKVFLLLILMFFIAFGASSCHKEKDDDDEEQIDFTDLSIRDFVGSNGMVAAANPFAAKAGLDVLKEGGNAFDAAVAVSFALGVVEPNASGIGGGGILVAYEASTGKYLSYNFREFVPELGVPTAFPNRDADIDDGIKSAGVPTQVAGLLSILENHGNLNRQTVLAPAINYAKNGVPVMPELAGTINDNFNKILRSRSETIEVFTSDGIEPLQEGELMIQTDYGNTLQKISDEGVNGFYTGSVADSIIATMQDQGGIISYDDLNYAMNNYPIEETPVQGTYRGYDIASATTPSSGGITLIEALNMLEIYGDVSQLNKNSAEYYNIIATAMQLAFGDKRKYVGDSKFVDVPISGLTSKLYAAERWEKYNPNGAYLGRYQGDDDYGDPWPYNTSGSLNISYQAVDYDEHYSTTAFSVADADGNIVSVTQTINHFFGNGVVPEGCGFFLNNQLSSFSFTSSSASYIQPFKQPLSHIMPTIIMKDGNPYATLGSPGSMRIPAAVLQVVVNMIDFGMDIQSAINQPRVFCYAASSTDYSTTQKDLYVEKSIPAEAQSQLSAMGYNVIVEGQKDIDLYFGGVHGIRFISENDTLHGGADPRRDGKALGY